MTSDPVIAAASAALGRELRDLGGLGGSPRSGVHRTADGEGSVVVKPYAGGSRTPWARERVGLGAAGAVGVAPRLLAAAADPPVVVMEDLGAAPSVADLLLGTDPRAAGSCWALVSVSWSGAVLVALSRPVTGFRDALRSPSQARPCDDAPQPARLILALASSAQGRSDLALALAPAYR